MFTAPAGAEESLASEEGGKVVDKDNVPVVVSADSMNRVVSDDGRVAGERGCIW